MRMRVTRLLICCCFFLVVCSNRILSQTIFTENFEGTFPPAGWTLINAGSGSPWQENTNQAYTFSGLKSMQCPSVGSFARNAWAITPNLSLSTGVYYRISYWFREAAPGRIEKMKVTLGNTATIAAQTTTLHDYTDIENLNNVEGADIFSVPANGNYNIGFYCNSSANTSASLLIDSIVFQQIGPVDCSGTSVTGAVAGPASVCSGANFTLNLSGTYVSNGLTFQWQSSPASAGTFNNIAGANSQSYTTSQTTATDYRCRVTCSNGGAPVFSNVFPVSMTTLCYCTPAATGCGLGYIGNVKIGSINNNSTCNGGGYSNYTGYVTATDLVVNSAVPVSVTPGGIAITQSVALWIDYNRNGVFELSEYKDLGGGVTTLNGTINIPANALLGLTTMRVKSKGGSTVPSGAACTSYSDGETEDYQVNLMIPVCSGTPAAGTTTCISSTICPDIIFTVKVSGATTGYAGLTYQWQRSADGSAWTDIAGATADTLNATQVAATYYRRKITCTASAQSAFSPGLQIGMNPYTNCYCIPGNSSCSGTVVCRIDSVGFSNIHNVSGCDGVNGYSDYTGTVAAANVQAGTLVSMTVKQNSSTLTRYLAVGIDFNHNGIFDASETTYGSGTTYINVRVRIPFNAITGPVRMRVRTSYYDTNPGFCYIQNYGEAEDYMVNISAATTPGPAFAFYVNPLATGNGDGLSWTNAFTSLMNTLSFVVPTDTIRVAKGTYTVSGSPYYFNIKDSVVMMGGYPNTGNPGDGLRNWGTNQTILSGAGVPVTVKGASGFTLDGFILQDVYSYPGAGGAIRITNGILPKIRHCVFRNNHCFLAGPGSAMRITNSSPVISDCFFVNNIDDGGSTILNETNSSSTFTNCVFAKNISQASIVENDQSTTSFINCDFVSNRTDTNTTVYGRNNSTFNIKNSIFFNNERQVFAGYGGYSIDSADVKLNNSTAAFSNTITQVYDYGNALLFSKNPKFKDTSSIAGPDNFYYTADDGLQLNNPCSPGMNTGSNASASGIITDILGNTRISSSIVDIGAYEVQTAPLTIPKTLYVNKTAVGNGSGANWANAMTDLQAAMQSCSDTIRVAAGTYYPSDTDEKKSIWLENKRVILGGYPNTGSPTDAQRDPLINITILSGEMPNGNGKRSDILLRGRTVDSTSVTDGLVIKKAESSNLDAMGAIYLVDNTNPVFRNCTISDNNSDGQGAGLININSSDPKFENCIFENNALTNLGEGGAVANINSTPGFKKCIFRYNSNYIAGVTPSSGGAVYNSGSNAIYDSCTFLKNIANNWGGAMDNVNSDPIISNCRFLGNLIAFGGNGSDINNDHSSPQVFNTFFSDSSSCNYGGSVINQNQSNPSFITCEFKNGHASAAGGACFNDNSSPLFVNCIFNGTVAGNGGVLYNQNSSSPVMVNCVATGNSAGGQGSFMYNNNSSPVIKNTTIVNGTLPSSGNSSRGGVIANYGTTQVTLSNCIIWGNTVISGQNVPNGDILDLTNAATPTIMNNSISQVFGTTGVNGNLVAVDPLFLNMANPAGTDNIFYTNDDGLNLASCSPAMNAGSNASIAGYNTDILNNPRIFNSLVDMGAYEIQSLPGLVTNTWTGSVSNIWENPLNWSLGVLPNPCTKVIINSGTVVLSSNTTIYNLTIGVGVILTVHTGYNLTILH
ncbi:MAG: GEVED domain-containing protein [Ferruginibacter sp.]